jgi:hypothetical protein
MVGGVEGQVNESPEVDAVAKINVARSRLDSLTRILANKRRKVVLTPVNNSYPPWENTTKPTR